jgi:hypothetical protein
MMKKSTFAIFLMAFLLTSVCVAQTTADKIFVEVGKLTPIEISIIKSVGNKDQGQLSISNDVKRYYRLINGSKQYIQNELIYKAQDGIIDNAYIYYELTFIGDENEMKINYSFSAGTALSGTGTVIKDGDSMVQTDIVWGSSARTTTVLVDNKVVYQITKDL